MTLALHGTAATYTTRLQAGLGLLQETRVLLELWHEGTDASTLLSKALQAGQFPGMSARRLRNLVFEGFAPRFLLDGAAPASLLKRFGSLLKGNEFSQLLFIYTGRANPILADFVREVYWGIYSSGNEYLSNNDAQAFVVRANEDGRTSAPWSEGTVRRVAGYLTGCCADFGLLEGGRKRTRKILPYRLEPRVAAVLAYDLHFAGYGDNALLAHPDWALFGMDITDVREELKRLALRGLLILQSAGGVTRISWQHKTMGELTDVVTRPEL